MLPQGRRSFPYSPPRPCSCRVHGALRGGELESGALRGELKGGALKGELKSGALRGGGS